MAHAACYCSHRLVEARRGLKVKRMLVAVPENVGGAAGTDPKKLRRCNSHACHLQMKAALYLVPLGGLPPFLFLFLFLSLSFSFPLPAFAFGLWRQGSPSPGQWPLAEPDHPRRQAQMFPDCVNTRLPPDLLLRAG